MVLAWPAAMRRQRLSPLAALLIPCALGAVGCNGGNRPASPAKLAVVGAAAIAGGAYLAIKGEQGDCDRASDGCFGNIDSEVLVFGPLMQIVGWGAMATGTGLVVTAAVEQAAASEPATPDWGACVRWQEALAAEADPSRRTALRTSRPAHCAPVEDVESIYKIPCGASSAILPSTGRRPQADGADPVGDGRRRVDPWKGVSPPACA